MGHASATGRQRLESAKSQALLTSRAAGEYLGVAPAVLGYLVRKVYEKSVWAMRLHLLTFQTVKTALLLIPFALLGLFLGMRSSRRLNEASVRKLTAVLLVLSGVSLILTNL